MSRVVRNPTLPVGKSGYKELRPGMGGWGERCSYGYGVITEYEVHLRPI
jgi:hypothetical protein